MRLFYEQEAQAWEETLPLGNGSLGAMIWGGKNKEKIGLNEESLWSGYPRNKNNENAYKYLDEVRELVFQGEYGKAQQTVEHHMLGEFTESYLPLGNFEITFDHSDRCEQYQRELSLDEAVARVSYDCGGQRYERSYFISYPAKAFIMRYTCEGGIMSTKLEFDSMLHCKQVQVSDGLYITGQCPEHMNPNYVKHGNIIMWGEHGLRFSCQLSVLYTDGCWKHEAESGIYIEKAQEIVLAFTFGNQKLPAASYDVLLQEHLNDYQLLYNRVELYLGEQPNVPTDRRLERLKNGASDPALYATYFHYSRYLLISSSRQGSLPATLQGIWNWQMHPPWSSNYTTNINLQMNYWPACSCNLTECMKPYFSFLERLVENGKVTAKTHYNCRGFSAAHNSDRWALTNPVGVCYGEEKGEDGCGIYAFFPLGGAWLTRDLWKYYEYSHDLRFLKETAYPILREAALFCVDWLVEYKNYYVTAPSSSPENYFYIPGGDGETASMIFACTMDMSIVKEIFRQFKKVCLELDLTDELLSEIETKESKLYPVQIGKFGQLQEWPFDFEEPEIGHRHISHLYGLYPGDLFEQDEVLKCACRVSLERRLLNGSGHTGWSCAWIANLYAVLDDGQKVEQFLHTLLTRSTYPNLWDAHPPFQIDGNFGGIEAIANALVQERACGLKILPALPPGWKSGYVKGLRIKNNRCVDIEWEAGKLKDYRIYNLTEEPPPAS